MDGGINSLPDHQRQGDGERNGNDRRKQPIAKLAMAEPAEGLNAPAFQQEQQRNSANQQADAAFQYWKVTICPRFQPWITRR